MAKRLDQTEGSSSRKPRRDRRTRRIVIEIPAGDDGLVAQYISGGLMEGTFPLGAMVRPTTASATAERAK
jgi:hypothetical protein